MWRIRRSSPAQITRSVALHHWCLKQGKLWARFEDVSKTERNMLVFLIVNEVLDMIDKELGGGPA